MTKFEEYNFRKDFIIDDYMLVSLIDSLIVGTVRYHKSTESMLILKDSHVIESELSAQNVMFEIKNKKFDDIETWSLGDVIIPINKINFMMKIVNFIKEKNND